jgi:hypothetical protein
MYLSWNSSGRTEKNHQNLSRDSQFPNLDSNRAPPEYELERYHYVTPVGVKWHVREVASLTRRPPFTPRKIPGIHFCYWQSRPQGHSVAGRIRSIEKSNDLIGNRTRDLLACSIVPQPTTRCHQPVLINKSVHTQLRRSYLVRYKWISFLPPFGVEILTALFVNT